MMMNAAVEAGVAKGRRTRIAWCCGCLFLAWAAMSVSARGAVTLVEDGQAVGQIVVPADASDIALYAAEELQAHVRQASSATLPIVREDEVKSRGSRVYVGDCEATRAAGIDVGALDPNGFVIRTVKGDLFVAGHDERVVVDDVSAGDPVGTSLTYNRSRVGTMFGIYELLDTQLGVRWLWPGKGGTYVPASDDIVVPAIDKVAESRFIFKWWRVPDFMRQEPGWTSAAARDEFLIAQNRWLRRHRYMQVLDARVAPGHSFEPYWERFGGEKPELFALLPNGKREPLAGDARGRRVTMCVAEPELWAQIIREWKGYRSPDAPWVRAGENDTPGLCICDKCRAWDAPDSRFETGEWGKLTPTVQERFRVWDWDRMPSLSNRYARFYLTLLREAKEVDPSAKVAGYAYANYSDGPQDVYLSEDVLIAVVPNSPYGSTSSVFFPYTEPKSRRFREQWDGWSRTGAQMNLRPNMTLSGHSFPIYYADRMGADVIYAAERGMVASDFDSLRGAWGAQAPTLYMLARAQERPELGVEGILDEFYSAFGGAEQSVRAYFDHWRSVSQAVTDEQMNEWVKESGGGAYTRWFLVAPYLFTDAVMARGRELLNEAVAAGKGDAELEARLEFLDRGLRDVEFLLAAVHAHRAYQHRADDRAREAYVEALTNLQGHRRDSEGWHIGNFGDLHREEARVFEWSLLAEPQPRAEVALPTWRFRWDPDEVGVEKGWGARELRGTDSWSAIGIGAWQTQAPGRAWEEAQGEAYHGVAWYRTTFAVPAATERPRRVALRFGAVDEAATVWVNGRLLLERHFDRAANPNSWDEPFEVDASDAVRPGEENVVAVRVVSRVGAGGITRPVRVAVED